MKTIKFLFISAIAAISIMSCEKEIGYLEKLNPIDSIEESKTTDPIDEQSSETVSGTGELATQTVNLSDFTEVELKKIGEVEIKSGSSYKVEVSDYENLLPHAKLYLEGKRLVISYDSVQVFGSKLKISITMPNKLTKTIVSGAGNINILSGFSSDNVQLIVSGAGNISAANINSSNTTIEMPGAGVIEAKGSTGCLTLKVKGSGPIKCQELMCVNAICEINGLSTVFLSTKDKLKVNALGIGNLTYYGTPILDLNLGMQFSVTKG